MENLNKIDFTFFGLLRRDVALIYDLYFDYVRQHIRDDPPYVVPDTFTLVSAFGCVFTDLKVVHGTTLFVFSHNWDAQTIVYQIHPHHWLIWRDKNHIIDLIPIDGKFGVSTPQAIIQHEKRERFFAVSNLYPKEWGKEKMAEFDSGLSDLVEILEQLMQKVPH